MARQAGDAAITASRGYALFVLGLLLLANTLSYADRHLFSVLIPAIKAEFGASDAMMGLIGGPAFILSYVLFSMPLAKIADRRSRRGVLAGAITLWSLATALCGSALGSAQLAVARLMVGVGEAGGMPPSQAMIADLFDSRRRSSALGVLASSTYFGIVLGLTGGAALASLWGWRWAFLALALPGLPLALLIWRTAPRNAGQSVEAEAQGISLIAAARSFWSIPSFRLLALGVGTFNIFGYAGAIWLPTYFMRSHGMSVVEAGSWLGLGAVAGGVAGSLASGLVVDALRVRDERWQLRIPALGFFLSFPLFVLMMIVPGGAAFQFGGLVVPQVAMISLATSFLTSLWAGPAFGAAARLIAPEHRAQASAMLVVVINILGSAVGPMAAGLVSDALSRAFGNEALRYSLLSLSLLTLAGGALFWRAATYYARDLPGSDRGAADFRTSLRGQEQRRGSH
ncbi:MFS transporter [Sphingomonas sp. DBB INV C78]|uniref:spinster family MFS transporter n=1 Tax=Sphingomonas sp. DBB INV C78 TaxID=3349434 RepID=UPI0036D3E528